MSATAVTAGASVDVPTIPVGKLAPWAFFTFLLAAVAVFFISAYGGVFSDATCSASPATDLTLACRRPPRAGGHCAIPQGPT